MLKIAVICALIAGVIAAALAIQSWALAGVWGLFGIGLFNLAISSMEAVWRMYADRSPEAPSGLRWPECVRPGTERLRFTLIVCALDEETVIGLTLDKLVRQTHPRCQILVSLRDHDVATIRAVERAQERNPGRIEMITGRYAESGKAAQLNGALPYASGDYVSPIDAECDVAPDLLRHVEALVRETGADIVQGAVQLMNLGTRVAEWFQPHNVLEYYAWYSSRMLFQVDAGFVPLGGNTVFVRTSLARAVGGWPNTPTEDCAMGVLLCSRYRARVVAAFGPRLATREEVPPTIFHRQKGSLFWQRVRWLEGIFQELLRGYWWHMPTLRQKLLAGYILAAPLLQALSCALLPVAFVTAFVAKVPEALALFLYLPLIPLSITMISMLLGLGQFGRDYETKVRLRHFASIALLTPVYQVILAAAAACAVYRHYWGDGTWYRTGRGMQHLSQVPARTEIRDSSSEGAVL
jgi:cellulose synthase/poly-beta-1,6-N-acetylglucosamine synthase-like glycosyltransferase